MYAEVLQATIHNIDKSASIRDCLIYKYLYTNAAEQQQQQQNSLFVLY